MSPELGITRVTDITRLDKIGIPVFASVRPSAVLGSLCVNAGKGRLPLEAKVGAYMEAIEFACAEPQSARVEVFRGDATSVLDGVQRLDAILDLCPIAGAEIRRRAPLQCVAATNLMDNRTVYLPAELVLLPYASVEGTGHFGSSSNGLASGNTAAEASLHGLLEVIERDIRSFMAIRDESVFVPLASIPSSHQDLVQAVLGAGLRLCIRSQPNEFGLPFFVAAIIDEGAWTPIYVSGGYGCHLSKEIALTRAICEAAQSRLSYIHGGRDDLVERYDMFSGLTSAEVSAYTESLVATLSDSSRTQNYEETADRGPEATSVKAALDWLLARLARSGVKFVCTTDLSPPDSPLRVTRVVVPLLEHFSQSSHRVGRRLRDFARKVAA